MLSLFVFPHAEILTQDAIMMVFPLNAREATKPQSKEIACVNNLSLKILEIQREGTTRIEATASGAYITGTLQATSSILGGTSSSNTDGQSNMPFRIDVDRSSYMMTVASNTWGLFWAGNGGARYGTNGNGGPGNIWGNSGNPNEFCFVGSDSTAWTVHGNTGNTWQGGRITCNEIYPDKYGTANGMAVPRYDNSFYVLQSQHWYGHTSSQTLYLGESGNTTIIRGPLQTASMSSSYGLGFTGGATNFLLYNNANENLLYMRDTSNGAMITTWETTKFRVNKDFVANSTATFLGDIYGKAVNNAHSALYRFGGIYFTWDSDSYGTNTQHSIRSTDGDTYGDHITLNSFGNVRINFDSNSNGTNYFRIGHATTHNGNVLLTIDESGNATFAGNVTAYSDERLKENIVNVDNALDKVCSMRGVYYNMIEDKTKSRRLGLVAQEVEKVLPEVVIEAKPEDDKDSILSVDYGNVVGLLVEAIKEQQEQIEELKKLVENK